MHDKKRRVVWTLHVQIILSPYHLPLVDQVHVDHWLCHPGEGNGDLPMKFPKLFHNIKENEGHFFFTETQFFKTAFPNPPNLVTLSL